MASIFKRTIHGRTSKVWYFKYREATGVDAKTGDIVYTWRTRKGWTSKAQTEEHALNVEAEQGAVARGEKAPPSYWSKGHLRPVGEVVAEYMVWGRERGGRGGRPWPKPNARKRERYLRWWASTLKWNTLGDVKRAAVEHEVDALLKAGRLAPKSVALQVEAAKAFASWAAGRGLLPANPLANLAKIDARPRKPHRPLTGAEVTALLKAAPPLRRLWYEVALATGFREGELRALKVKDFNPDVPCLVLGADFTKNRKPARQFISLDLSAKLSALTRFKPGDLPLLGIPTSKAWRLLKDDCKAAEIVMLTTEGRATWHSLRKSFVNAVVRGGADVKTAMELARHSSASMTMDTYASADEGRLRAAAQAAAEKFADGTPVVMGPDDADEAKDVTARATELCGAGVSDGASGSSPPALTTPPPCELTGPYVPVCAKALVSKGVAALALFPRPLLPALCSVPRRDGTRPEKPAFCASGSARESPPENTLGRRSTASCKSSSRTAVYRPRVNSTVECRASRCATLG